MPNLYLAILKPQSVCQSVCPPVCPFLPFPCLSVARALSQAFALIFIFNARDGSLLIPKQEGAAA